MDIDWGDIPNEKTEQVKGVVMTLEEIRKHKENQPSRECYSNNCPLHDDYGVTDKDRFEGPFAQCDASLCDKYVKSGDAK